VEAILAECGFSELQVPQSMAIPSETLKRIDSERASTKNSQKSLRDEIAGISRSEIKKVKSLLRSLEVEAERAEITSRFPSSRSMSVIEGWMLDESKAKLDAIAHRYGSSISLEDVHFSHDEMPPTVLDNPKIASPMEFITNSYSLPNYNELDPTMAYLVALPIIYGMIVGDVIYGIMSMLLALWLMKKFEKSYIMSNVSKIWLYSGIPAIIFGFFFDEFAGLSHFKISEFIRGWTGIAILKAPLWVGFHRMEGVLALVALSALIGVLHLGLGFIFGAINEWHHSKKHAFAKISWLCVEIGIVLALLPFLPSMLPELGHIEPALTTVGLALLVIGVLGLGATEGIIGIIEIPGLVGNILSYSRIAAIGVVGVVIAELLNEFIIPSPEKGLLLALILAPVFIIFHFLNCFVAMFEAIVQGGRLNIVEFRSKFMHGGGDVFIPFALYSKKL
jgi:V/A-type H+-transporting ATPase subunit I